MKNTDRNNDAERRNVDRLLQRLNRAEPPAGGLLEVRRRLNAVTRPQHKGDIMTLEEAGEMLRLKPAELEQIVPELPAFELAGRILIRRQRLLEWIENREKAFAGASIQSAVEKSMNLQFKENVA